MRSDGRTERLHSPSRRSLILHLGQATFLTGSAVGALVTFETVPVVHLDRARFPEYPDADPEAVLTGLARRFERVVVVDAQGVRANDADLEFLPHPARNGALWDE